MKILHRFILAKFLSSFLVFFMLFVGFFVLLEMFELRSSYDLSRESLADLTAYLAFRIPFLAYVSSPIAVIISAIFVIAVRAHQSEVIASQAGGVSLFSYAFPITASSAGIAFLLLAGSEFVVPEFSDRADFIKRVEIQKRTPPKVEYFDMAYFENGNYVLAGHFYAEDGLMETITVVVPTESGPFPATIVYYPRLTYRGAWMSDADSASIVTSPPKAIELAVSSGSLKLLSNKSAETVRLSKLWFESRELRDLIRRDPSLEKLRPEIALRRVKMQSKLAFPLTVPFLAIFCSALAARVGRRKGLGTAIGSALACTLGYMVLLQSTMRFGELAARLPEWQEYAVFVPWALPLAAAFVAFNAIRSPMPRWMAYLMSR